MSDLQRDFDAIAPLAAREQYTWEAFTRIRARLTPDRERVATAIHDANTTGLCGEDVWLARADAAIKAMEGKE